jgi:hypothetical protein
MTDSFQNKNPRLEQGRRPRIAAPALAAVTRQSKRNGALQQTIISRDIVELDSPVDRLWPIPYRL